MICHGDMSFVTCLSFLKWKIPFTDVRVYLHWSKHNKYKNSLELLDMFCQCQKDIPFNPI